MDKFVVERPKLSSIDAADSIFFVFLYPVKNYHSDIVTMVHLAVQPLCEPEAGQVGYLCSAASPPHYTLIFI